MLLVAIPKSGSTSLMVTLGRAHGLAVEQLFFPHLPPPSRTRVLHRYHSDVRELEKEVVHAFSTGDRIFKQHIPPTRDNLRLLRPIRKVILLRPPEEIVQAYFRAERRGLHRPREEFRGCDTADDWVLRAGEIGLLDDLSWFQGGWREEGKAHPEQCLTIGFRELTRDTTRTVNAVESFLGLSTSDAVSLSRERYSRESPARRRMRHLGTLARKLMGRG